MKILNVISLVVLVSFWACAAKQEGETENYALVQDSVFNHIEISIEQAFIKSISTDDMAYLDKIYDQLKNNPNPQSKGLGTYWMAYIYFKKAIVYIKNSDKKNSKKAVNQGIDLLEDKNNKNDEDYALLGYLQNFAIQFKSGPAAGIYSSKIKKNAEKSLEINSKNIRAYLVLGTNDFFTPERYGGGKKAEMYFVKAVDLEAQAVENPYLPSWGKNEVYLYLIRLYIKKQQYDLAKKYFKEATKHYPDDYQINQLAKQLVDK